MNQYCIVCHDPNAFSVAVSNAKNIDNRLSRIFVNYDKSITISREIERTFAIENNHISILCGQCPKIHMQSLRNVEKSINDKVKKLAALIESHTLKDADYFLALTLLRGNYSRSYRNLEIIHAKNAA
jgi:hypothetical protein